MITYFIVGNSKKLFVLEFKIIRILWIQLYLHGIIFSNYVDYLPHLYTLIGKIYLPIYTTNLFSPFYSKVVGIYSKCNNIVLFLKKFKFKKHIWYLIIIYIDKAKVVILLKFLLCI